MGVILIKGACQHNLKGLDLEIPLNRLVLVSGPSGAGKSSLVISTIFAEAQRRYLESFSPYVRQYVEQSLRPEVRSIENLPAAIAIGQANPVRNSRSTVATITEVTYYTRMLFFRMARPWCLDCGLEIVPSGTSAVLAKLDGLEEGSEIVIASPVPEKMARELAAQGYFRAIRDGRMVELMEAEGPLSPGDGQTGDDILLVVDRFRARGRSEADLKEAISNAFFLSRGRLVLLEGGSGRYRQVGSFSRQPVCPGCGRLAADPAPSLFSFNSPDGACSECKGFGRVIAIDWDLVVPDKGLSLIQGAIRPLKNWDDEREELFSWCRAQGIDLDRPWRELSRTEQEQILFGHGDWYGIKAIFDYLETKRYKAHVRILLARYRTFLTCSSCGGSRFSERARSFRLAGLDIGGFYAMSVSDALSWCHGLEASAFLDEASGALLGELISRLRLMEQIGLGYLTLDRQSRTLSGGELQRLSLARAADSGLSEMLFCLDEPSSGLHPADVLKVARALKGLKGRRNTVIVVDNDPVMRRVADLELRMGPGSGREGGRVVASGAPAHLMAAEREGPASACLKDLGRQERKAADDGEGPRVILKGACAHNLKGVDIEVCKGLVTVVCGVSGSGKSSLVHDVLFRALKRMLGQPVEPPGPFERIEGHGWVRHVELVDQEPLSRNFRACPGTYLKLLDRPRRLLASTEEARGLGLSPGAFSINTRAGRCPECEGQGLLVMEMQFLPDMLMLCPRCRGARFKEEVLSIRYDGRSIADFFDMTLEEYLRWFRSKGERVLDLERRIGPALELGLGYLLVGQPLNTLSAGEAQRLKIARMLGSGLKKDGIMILDEPTRGLSAQETTGLIRVLRRIAREGNGVLVVEHDPSMILSADSIYELGPGGGEEGGRIIFSGSPDRLLRAETPTGRALSAFVSGSDPEGQGQEGLSGLHGPCRTGGGLEVQAGDSPSVAAIEIRGARHRNLKDLDIAIPRGLFTVITGVSGSGKSTLAFDIVHGEARRRYIESLPSYMKQFVKLGQRPDVSQIFGLSPSVAIEQHTFKAGRSSTVATISEISNYLRLFFSRAAVREDMMEGGLRQPERPDPGLFSFNTVQGRCQECQGTGLAPSGGTCHACGGTRLCSEARAWKVDGMSISDLFRMEVSDALGVVRRWRAGFAASEGVLSRLCELICEVERRLSFMEELGLSYLPLDRTAAELSAGEQQRLRLACQAGSGLVGLTVVLDEPTIGLHPSDNMRLIKALKRLAGQGNTVLVVEHDEECIRNAQHIIDLGPGGGAAGGRVVYQGGLKGLMACRESATSAALSDRERRAIKTGSRAKDAKEWLVISGADAGNLKAVEIRLPLNAVTVITGVSGAGKSTLLTDVLARIGDEAFAWKAEGRDALRRIVTVDHSPIGRTPRSCPATYTKVFDTIRQLMSRVPLARSRGFDASYFSFNLPQGQCPECQGQGWTRQKLGILPDVLLRCEACMGRRFKREILDVRYKGKDISQILDMTISQALEFFRAVTGLSRTLRVMDELGLGYLTLGQPSPTLSGGEAQRVKLARHLVQGPGAGNLYLLDEPSTGLHIQDTKRVIRHLDRLVDAGATVVVVEHNLDIISKADWIIDLGPRGGRLGGEILFSGTPRELLKLAGTNRTASALKDFLEG